MTDIAANFDRIRAQMKRAERIAGREEGETNLIAVTKTQNQETLAAAAAIGHRLFGENKVQEAQAHWSALRAQYSDIVLHMIGPLQTNKAAEAVGLFDVIETLDREKLAFASDNVRVMHPGPMNRGVEIDSAVADGAQAVILPQVTFGIAVRMAVMSMLTA